MWDIWETFCISLPCDTYLEHLPDPIPILQLFTHRYRNGTLAPSNTQVRSLTVEDALQAIGQAFTTLGKKDPRLQPLGKLDFRLSRQLSAYKKQDPPPTRVKPIPFPMIAQTVDLCCAANTPANPTIADMLLLGFYFLLCPGEYTFTDNEDAAPFQYCDVHLLIHSHHLNHYTCSDEELQCITYIGLEFTNQKNGVHGELVGLGKSGHPTWCPVHALLNCIKHMRHHHASPTTPLYKYFDRTWKRIYTILLTRHLHNTVTALGLTYGIQPHEISIGLLRALGAMALLCAQVDTDMIHLLGRWQSDEMLRYLHIQSFPMLAPLVSQMLNHGQYTMTPNHPLLGELGAAGANIR
jgi:hypothetical protein